MDEDVDIEGIDEMQYTSKSFDPPVDWTLKREWTFFSPQSFEWCSASSSLGECQALNGFVQVSSGGDLHAKEVRFLILYFDMEGFSHEQLADNDTETTL